MNSPQRLLAAGGLLTFALLGAIQSLYGPLLPGLRRAFEVDLTEVGFVFTAHGLGAMLGILAPSVVRAPALTRRWLGAASGLLLLGATGVFLAPNWPLLLAAAFVQALGFGIHVVRLNSLFVAGFGARGMTMSQLINAAFSVGTILGPVALALSGEPTPRIFGAVALVAALLLPLNAATDNSTRELMPASTSNGDERGRARASHVLLAAFVLMMFLVVGVETSIGGWTTTLALAQGYSYPEAANLTGLFFGSILGGRLVAAAFAHRVPAGAVVVAAIAAIGLLLVAAALTPAGVIAFALAGLAIAPIFSATLVWVRAALPAAAHANALVIAGALLGAAVFPALIGRVIQSHGAAAAAPAILVLAAAALAVAAWLSFARRA